MAHRKNVEIKTKYESVESCMKDCRDIKKKTTIPVPASGKIYGVVHADGSFWLSSRKAKTSVIFEFVGYIEERNDAVYMVGEIRPKRYQKWIMIGFSLVFHLIGIVFIWTGQVGGIISGIMLFVFAWIYVIYLWKGDSLYCDLLKKLQ